MENPERSNGGASLMERNSVKARPRGQELFKAQE